MLTLHMTHLTTKFFDPVNLNGSGSADLPGGHSERVPPESISNSVVKTFCADDSAEVFRVKVGTAGHNFVLHKSKLRMSELGNYTN